MIPKPLWLPKELCYADYEGNWGKFLSDVYDIFLNDFKRSQAKYEGHTIVYDSTIELGKERVFWHLIQRQDYSALERLPDIRRCERIPWPRPIIEHSSDNAISVWKKEIKRQTRIHIWLESLDYIVVLAEMPRVIALVTAFCTDIESHRKKLMKDRKKYEEMQKPPRKAT